ncbi:MAG: hypothetical protein L3J36_02445 [Rhodobacteraceae bacterium]|nr:hypothetical protein [Paracoccaceae bacterium]
MTVTTRNPLQTSSWRHIGALGVSLLAGCTTAGLGPDALEVANIKRSNIVPKSSPGALVHAFDKYCVNGPRDRTLADALLRKSNYVPRPRRGQNKTRVYVIDNKRPLVALTQNICVVQARSRTGQTHKFRAYIANTFPRAKPVPPGTFWHNIEQAWAVPSDPPAIVATQRDLEPGNFSRYGLIYYQPAGTTKRGND